MFSYCNQGYSARFPLLAGRVLSLCWHPSGTRIAAGMMDMIRVFDVQTGESPEFKRNVKYSGIVFCILLGNIVFLVCECVYSPKTDPCLCAPGHSIHRLLVDKAAGAPRDQECVVWSVVYLSDGTVISGDSAGRVKVWDSQMGTLLKNHDITKWDVLALSVSQVNQCKVKSMSNDEQVPKHNHCHIGPMLHLGTFVLLGIWLV